MVIAKRKWFKGKEGSYLERYDISWQGIAYITVMFAFPLILVCIFPADFILAGYYQNLNIDIIALAWLTFSFIDCFDLDLKDPLIKPLNEKEKNFKIAEINAGWSIILILLTGVLISIICNMRTWNFQLGLFTTTTFIAFMIIAITKYRFEKENQNGNYSKKCQIDGEHHDN